jgi:hypothetical protein
MWASGINYPAPSEAEKRVCAAFGSKRTFAYGAALQLISKDVDFTETRALPANLRPLFKGGIIRKGATQLHNLQNRAFHKFMRTCIAHVGNGYIV